MCEYLLSEIRFSDFVEELTRDSDNTFSLSTCLEPQTTPLPIKDFIVLNINLKGKQ